MKVKIFIIISIVLISCKTNKLPTVKYNSYSVDINTEYKNDTLFVKIKNPLFCPLRYIPSSSNIVLQEKLNKSFPIIINAQKDTILIFSDMNKLYNLNFNIQSFYGDYTKKIDTIKLDLPFPKNKQYSVMQGNNTNFTHNNDFSRYAIDFDLKTNDTICAASDGYVVGVIDKYKDSGKTKEWRDYANFITIYEPISGVFMQYVHLVENGSLVKIGDKITRGQKIGLSGNTGYSNKEHLHFNCLVPVNNNEGLKSIPITFSNGVKGIELKIGDVLRN
jgi:murein DD-endopeptidase MepM/ murein hydrolase activator NlpD